LGITIIGGLLVTILQVAVGLGTTVGQGQALQWNPWFTGAAFVGVVTALLGVWLMVASHKAGFVEAQRPHRDGAHYITLARKDGTDFGYAVPRVRRKRMMRRGVDQGEPDNLKRWSPQGDGVTYCFPEHFSGAETPPPAGRYIARWSVSPHAEAGLRKRSSKRANRTHLRISDEDHAAAEAKLNPPPPPPIYECGHEQVIPEHPGRVRPVRLWFQSLDRHTEPGWLICRVVPLGAGADVAGWRSNGPADEEGESRLSIIFPDRFPDAPREPGWYEVIWDQGVGMVMSEDRNTFGPHHWVEILRDRFQVHAG